MAHPPSGIFLHKNAIFREIAFHSENKRELEQTIPELLEIIDALTYKAALLDQDINQLIDGSKGSPAQAEYDELEQQVIEQSLALNYESDTSIPSDVCELMDIPNWENKFTREERWRVLLKTKHPNKHLSEQSYFDGRFTTCIKLGQGGFGEVFRTRSRDDNKEYALKKIKLTGLTRHADRYKGGQEIHFLSSLHHPNVVRLFPSFWLSYEPETSACAGSHSDFSVWEPAAERSESAADFEPPSRDFDSTSTNSHGDRNETSASDSGNVLFGSTDGESADQHSTFTDSKPESQDVSRTNGFTSFDDQTKSKNVAITSSFEFNNAKESQRSGGNCVRQSDTAPTNESGGLALIIRMELCDNYTLENWLEENNSRCNRSDVLHIYYQLVKAIEYLHSKGLMHRDLKPANVLFSLNGRKNGKLEVKVGDLGLATAVNPAQRLKRWDQALSMAMEEAEQSFHRVRYPIDVVETWLKMRSSLRELKEILEELVVDDRSAVAGTPTYQAPEVSRGEIYNEKVDIYSLGLILFELLVSIKTTSEKHALFKEAKALRFRALKAPDSCAIARDEPFLRMLLATDSKDRPSAAQLRRCGLFSFELRLRNDATIFDSSNATVEQDGPKVQTMRHDALVLICEILDGIRVGKEKVADLQSSGLKGPSSTDRLVIQEFFDFCARERAAQK